MKISKIGNKRLKNTIINGNFDFWQRGLSGFVGNGAIFTADRWLSEESGAGNREASRSTDVPNDLSDFSLLWECTTADAVLDAGDLYVMEYRVEGRDMLPLHDKDITLSFYIKSNKVGTYTVAFQNSNNDRSYVVEYVIEQLNTWELKTVTLKHDSTGSWSTGVGLGMRIRWGFGVGSSKTTSTLDQWQAGDFRGTTNSHVNIQDNTANEFRLSQVTLNEGRAASGFQRAGEDLTAELHLCYRYYEKSYDLDDAPGSVTSSGARTIVTGTNATTTSGLTWFPKRVAPAVTGYNASTGTINQCRSVGTGVLFTPVFNNIGLLGHKRGSISPGGESNESFELQITLDAEI